MTSFHRDKAILTKSYALQQFHADQAQINDYYWIGLAASETFAFSAKQHADDADPMIALSAPSKFDRHLGHDMKELKKRSTIERRWARLLTILMMTSALERYMIAIASTAISSDPTLSPSFPKRVDGAVMAKYNLHVERPLLTGLVKGEWPKRIAHYRRLFKTVPIELTSSVSGLEKLRKTRNNIAHEFGFQDSALDAHTNVLLGARRLHLDLQKKLAISDEALIEGLRTIGSVASAIDKHLMSEHIGGYEALDIYFSWNRNPNKFEASVGISLPGHAKSTKVGRLATMLGTLTEVPVGFDYARELIDFVEAL